MATNVQEFIQNLVPTQSNNGNPNTVYNNAPPSGGAPIPVMDAFGNWSMPTISPAATATFRRNPNAPWLNVGTGGTGINFPGLPQLPPLTSTPFTPGVPNNAGGGINPWTPPTQIGGGAVAGPGGGAVGGGGGRGPSIMDQLSQGGISGTQLGGFNPGSAPNYGAPAKPIDWRQVLDVVSEPFFPGDVWLSGTNEFDFSNTLESLANQLGIPATTLIDAGVGLTGGIDAILNKDPETWTRTEAALADRYLDNARNQLANQLSSLSGGMLADISAKSGGLVSQTARDAMSKLGLSYIPQGSTQVQGTTSGARGAFMGAPVFDSPQAREAAIAGVQDALRQSASRSPNNRQTGGDLYGRAYEF